MRRTGKTTRKIDEAINILFTLGEVTVPFNIGNRKYFNGKDKRTIIIDPDAAISNGVQRDLFSRLRRRVLSEHPHQCDVDVKNMIIRVKSDGES